MPIFASNFSSNSLSGSALVLAGNVTINLSSAAFALEGDKTFVVKLRRGSAQGTVLATSPVVTIKDRTSFVSLTANTSTVAEGNLVSFTVVTANVQNGATLYYSVFPVLANITSSDFVANTGSFAIISNSGTFALKANADLSLMDETGENFKVQLRTNSPTGNIVYLASNIAILDTSKQYSYSTLSQSNVTLQGSGGLSAITFNLTTLNAVGANLYYSMTGNADGTVFTTANTGYFIVPANNFTTLNFTANLSVVPLNESRTFQLVIKEESTGPTKITSNVVVITKTPAFAASATTGTLTTTDSGGYRRHKYTGSGTVTFNQPGTVEYVVVGGGGQSGLPLGGGGGAGGLLTGSIAVTGGTPYTLTVGGGGSPSSFPAVGTALAGGAGAVYNTNGSPGGSGGGGTFANNYGGTGAGAGEPGQGNPGAGGYTTYPFYGYSPGSNSGGGGGAGGAGSGVNGGAGTTIPWSGTYAGGGGGTGRNPGGSGYNGSPSGAGGANTGNGGGFSAGNDAGGSGIIDIRYAYSA